MRYIGLDIHKEFIQAGILNDDGVELSNSLIPSDVDSINVFLDGFVDAILLAFLILLFSISFYVNRMRIDV